MKTTVYLPASDYRRLQALAEREGRSTAELLREAVTAYAREKLKGTRPRSIGAARSGQPDLAARTDELLSGLGALE